MVVRGEKGDTDRERKKRKKLEHGYKRIYTLRNCVKYVIVFLKKMFID